MLQAFGPFWDGNEVWLIIAGAATFAARGLMVRPWSTQIWSARISRVPSSLKQ